jgi:hypothetical protein
MACTVCVHDADPDVVKARARNNPPQDPEMHDPQ